MVVVKASKQEYFYPYFPYLSTPLQNHVSDNYSFLRMYYNHHYIKTNSSYESPQRLDLFRYNKPMAIRYS